MITRPQPDLAEQRATLRTLAVDRSGYEGPLTAGSARALLGCYGQVRAAGTIRTGDPIELLS